MSLKIVVLAKQVPDTRNVGKDAMTAEGTVNRAAGLATQGAKPRQHRWRAYDGSSTRRRNYPSGTLSWS